MPVAYIMCGDRDRILPFCAVLTPQVEPYKEEGVFLGLDDAGGEKFAASELFKKGRCGVAASKLTARIACMVLGKTGKPVWLQKPDEADFLAPLPVDFLWPLEEQVIEHLKLLGLVRIGDAAGISKEELCLQFGEEGPAIYDYCRGIDVRPVLSLFPPDNLQVERCFEGIFNKEAFEKILSEMISQVSRELLSRHRGSQSLCIELIEENGHTSSISKNFAGPVTVFDRGFTENIVAGIEVKSPVVGIRVTAGNLKPAQFTQGVLWEDTISKKKNDIHRIIASMRNKFPRQKICLAGEIQTSRREKALSIWDPFRYVYRDK